MPKTTHIKANKDATKGLLKGMELVNDAVSSTLGPHGRNVLYEDYGTIKSTKDGVTVAKNIGTLEDPIRNMGAQLLKQASIKSLDTVGDGTTTTTLLCYTLVNEGFNYINNPFTPLNPLKQQLKQAEDLIITELDNLATPVDSPELMGNIALISSNGDEHIRNVVMKAINTVGVEGVISVEPSNSNEIYLEEVEGLQFTRGYKSPYFVTDNDNMLAKLTDVNILLYNGRLDSLNDILPVLDRVSQTNKSLLLVADEFGSELLSTLIVNKMKGNLKCCAVKSPEYGDRKRLIMEDIAIMTGGQLIDPDLGMDLKNFDEEWFGTCQSVNISDKSTTIIGSNGDEESIIKRINELKAQYDNSEASYEKEKINERLGNMNKSVVIVHVGGNSEIEVNEAIDRIDDAIHAVRAAVDQGFIPGGGKTLVHVYNNIKGELHMEVRGLIKTLLYSPLTKILSNAGYEDEDIKNVFKKLKNIKLSESIDIDNIYEIIDYVDEGIIDPVKVTKSAINNAFSLAITIILNNTVIYTEGKDDNPMPLM